MQSEALARYVDVRPDNSLGLQAARKPGHQPKLAELRTSQRNEDIALIKPLPKVEAVLDFQFHFLT